MKSHPFLEFAINYPSVIVALIGMVACLIRSVRNPQDGRRNDFLMLGLALALPANALAEMIAQSVSILRPYKYDLYIYRLDGIFGFQPSFVIGRLVAEHASLTILVSVSYSILPMVMAGVLAAHLWGRPRTQELGHMVRAFVLNLMAALPIYCLIPVCGPQFAFPDFPWSSPPVAAHPIPLSAAPNGIPSVHFSTALLITWYLRHWTWGKWCGGAYLALTALATLGSGQHYVFDLIVAIPYAYAVCSVTRSRVRASSALTAPSEAEMKQVARAD